MDGWTGLVLYRDSYVAMALSDGTKQKYINPDDDLFSVYIAS